MNGLTRREFVQAVAASGGALALGPACGSTPATGRPSFFTLGEQQALARFADFLLPPDSAPGGAGLGTVPYLEQLLTALDGAGPLVFAGGPYSNRNPYPASDGMASARLPSNDFNDFLFLDRVQLRGWQLQLFGSSGVPGGGPNDSLAGPGLGPIAGLRDTFKVGIQQALTAATSPIPAMSDEEVATLWATLPVDFQSALIEAILEATFSAPEYGGNPGGQGWQLVHYEGDCLPLGYSLYDAASDSLVERPEAPVSTPNPGTDPDPMDANTEALCASLTNAVPGGRQFE